MDKSVAALILLEVKEIAAQIILQLETKVNAVGENIVEQLVVAT